MASQSPVRARRTQPLPPSQGMLALQSVAGAKLSVSSQTPHKRLSASVVLQSRLGTTIALPRLITSSSSGRFI
ncbi:hypothetical protein FA13DRAFT_1735114 [Coprinellus micaceus]|uniref:Uncharacterized protein n=1 Tax=Coprinellus micaceus TaxID=71717 RepID=A0A4Y7T4P7_COPMI|nr:hypothetical protein FA13DRAFT_1735114 [Coprinellus micaceus]